MDVHTGPERRRGCCDPLLVHVVKDAVDRVLASGGGGGGGGPFRDQTRAGAREFKNDAVRVLCVRTTAPSDDEVSN